MEGDQWMLASTSDDIGRRSRSFSRKEKETPPSFTGTSWRARMGFSAAGDRDACRFLDARARMGPQVTASTWRRARDEVIRMVGRQPRRSQRPSDDHGGRRGRAFWRRLHKPERRALSAQAFVDTKITGKRSTCSRSGGWAEGTTGDSSAPRRHHDGSRKQSARNGVGACCADDVVSVA